MRSESDNAQATEAFSRWDQIMSQWDDKKSHEINEKHVPIMKQASQHLNELISDTMIELRRIAAENDSVY